MSTPQVKAITDRQEMETFLLSELGNKEKHDLNYYEVYARQILNQEGWYYVSDSPCTCPHGGHEGHNLTCGYYYKGLV